jgi:hypothetical protein
MRYSKGWSFVLGYTHNLGFNTPLNFSSETSSGGSTQSTKIRVTQLPAGTLNISTVFNKFRGNKKAWLFEFGYGIKLQKEPWQLIESVGDFEKAKRHLRFLEPGGLMFGIIRQFGI